MKYLYAILFLLLGAVHSYGQNLVPNPSFEDTVSCPDFIAQIYNAKGCFNFGGSPDYFNECDQSSMWADVPKNYFGNQNAASGKAYCGLITFELLSGWREYIGIKLENSLSPGIRYYVRFKTSLAEVSRFATNNIGVKFSTIIYDSSKTSLTDNNSIIFSPLINSDSLNWTNISGSFIADSAYKYLIIGNFFKDQYTDTLRITNNSFPESLAYYYIDDICVSSDSSTCLVSGDGVQLIAGNKFTLYPNPAHDMVYLHADGEYRGALINILGQVVMPIHITGNSEVDVTALPRGMYILEVFNRNKLPEKIKLVLN